MRRDASARNVVPVDFLLFEEDMLRIRHADLAGLDEQQLWAERVVVEHELARLIFNRIRPVFLDHALTDRQWLAGRAGRLRDEMAKRRATRGRYAA